MENIGHAIIKAFGVGGGGCNAIARTAKVVSGPGVEFIAVNTDARHLEKIDVPVKVRLGERLTRGLGAGGDPAVGRQAAEESKEQLKELIKGSDMVFVTAGMGGGTGTGAAPVIAQIAKESGALTIGIVTRPFAFEMPRKSRLAEEGITRLKESVDALIEIPNDRLLTISDKKTSAEAGFKLADEVLLQGIQAVTELVTVRGDINVDFADIRAIMSNSGQTLMAIGHGTGENGAREAAKKAISNPLLDISIEGAKGVLINVTGGPDLPLSEVDGAAEVVAQYMDPDANIKFGMVIDPTMGKEVRVVLIATGFSAEGYGKEELTDARMRALLQESTEEFSTVAMPPFLRNASAGSRKSNGL